MCLFRISLFLLFLQLLFLRFILKWVFIILVLFYQSWHSDTDFRLGLHYFIRITYSLSIFSLLYFILIFAEKFDHLSPPLCIWKRFLLSQNRLLFSRDAVKILIYDETKLRDDIYRYWDVGHETFRITDQYETVMNSKIISVLGGHISRSSRLQILSDTLETDNRIHRLLYV